MGRLYCPRSMAGPHCGTFRQERASQHHGNQDNCSICSTRGVHKNKAIPLQALTDPSGVQDDEVPRFPDSHHTKVVRLSALRSCRLYPPKEILPVLSSVRSGIESRWGKNFPPVQTGPGATPSLLYNGYRVFPGGKVRPERAADHSPPSSAAVMEE